MTELAGLYQFINFLLLAHPLRVNHACPAQSSFFKQEHMSCQMQPLEAHMLPLQIYNIMLLNFQTSGYKCMSLPRRQILYLVLEYLVLLVQYPQELDVQLHKLQCHIQYKGSIKLCKSYKPLIKFNIFDKLVSLTFQNSCSRVIKLSLK